MKRFYLSRRDAILAALGGVFGGGAAIAAGLTWYDLRQRARRKQHLVKPPADDGWLITTAEREALANGDALAKNNVLETRD